MRSQAQRVADRIHRLWQKGLTYDQIGERVQRSPRLVYERLRAAGLRRNAVPKHGYKRSRSKLRAPAIRLFQSGLTALEVGIKLGITRERVCQFLRQEGIPRRTHQPRKRKAG